MSWFNRDRYRRVDILITPEAREKQEVLVDLCEGEVGWFGLVDRVVLDGEELDRVYDILVPKQEVSLGSVDHEGFDLGEFLEDHMEVADRMRFYGHSHVNGACFPSGIDLNQIREWSKYGMPYIISHIQNKRGEMYTRVDQFQPRKLTSPGRLVTDFSPQMLEWGQSIIENNVTEKKYTYSGGKRFKSIYNKGDRVLVDHYTINKDLEGRVGVVKSAANDHAVEVTLDPVDGERKITKTFWDDELKYEDEEKEVEREAAVAAGPRSFRDDLDEDEDGFWSKFFGRPDDLY